MSTSSSMSGRVPATLTSIPVEIFYQIISDLHIVERLKLRLVCREVNRRVLDAFTSHPYCFRRATGNFNRKSLQRILKIAHYPTAQRFISEVRISMTKKGKMLGSPRTREWKRDVMGYIAHPEQVYEICVLNEIMQTLPDCRSFRLTYDINRKKKRGQWRGSLKFTVETILAICAVAEVNIKGLQLCDHSSGGGSHPEAIGSFIVNKDRPFRPWDKTKPILDAACALIPALQLTIEPEAIDFDWVKEFIPKCTNLEKLSVKFEAERYYRLGLHHPFFSDVAATPAQLPPVQVLMLESNGFTMSEIVGYVGRFKDSLREINLCRVTLDGGSEWPAFFDWLRENVPNLEKFEFQALRHAGHGNEREIVCYDSIYEKNPELDVEISPNSVHKTANIRLTGGTLHIHHSNAVLVSTNSWTMPSRESCIVVEISGRTDDWKGIHYERADSSNVRYENGPAYNVQYEGWNVGAREALGLLALSGRPRILSTNSARSNSLTWASGIL